VRRPLSRKKTDGSFRLAADFIAPEYDRRLKMCAASIPVGSDAFIDKRVKGYFGWGGGGDHRVLHRQRDRRRRHDGNGVMR